MTSGPLHPDRELIIGVTPGARPDGRLVVALCRAGALGVLDAGRDPVRARTEMDLVVARHDGPFGVRLAADSGIAPGDLPDAVDTVVVADARLVGPHRAAGRRVLGEATSLVEARSALAAGADGLVAKGAEAGGRVGEETAFVLLQRLVGAIDAPVWLQGGIGLAHRGRRRRRRRRGRGRSTRSWRWPRDTTLPREVRSAIGAMDGSETVVVGGHRVYTRPDLSLARCRHHARRGRGPPRRRRPAHTAPPGRPGRGVRPPARRPLQDRGRHRRRPAGVDRRPPRRGPRAAAARPGSRHRRHPGHVAPDRPGPDDPRQRPRRRSPPRSPTAAALPFLALALMRGDEVRTLLAETAAAARRPAVGRRHPRLRPARSCARSSSRSCARCARRSR